MRPLTRSQRRRLGLFAIVGGVVGLIYFPFHASSYFATSDGAEMLETSWVRAWDEAFRAAVGPALTFTDPDGVYLFWGKFMTVAIAAHLCGIVALHAWQRHAGGKLMRAAYHLVLVAAGLMATAVFILNWIPGGLIDAVFIGMAVPSVLLTMIAYPLYGIATLRARVAPRGPAWLMTFAAFPGIVAMAALVGHLGGGLSLLHLTWILMGVAIRRDAVEADATQDDTAIAA